MDKTDKVIDALTEAELRARLASAQDELKRRVAIRICDSTEEVRGFGLGGSVDISVSTLIARAAAKGFVLKLVPHDGRKTTVAPAPDQGGG